MLIEIDLKTCKDLQVTPNQLIYIKLLIDSTPSQIKTFAGVCGISQEDVNSLIERGILDPTSSAESIWKNKLTESFLSSLEQVNYFDEFYAAYPKMIIRPDGLKDYLRTDITRCRRYYDQIVGKSRIKHENMMKCLIYDVDLKRKTNKMGYMKKMPKWLVSEEWKVYEEIIADNKVIVENKEVSYGNAIE